MENRPWLRHYDYNVPTTIRYPRLNAHDLLGLPANTYPDKPATNFYGTEITFYDFRRQVLRMANALGTLGVEKGDRVGLHLPTSPQYIVAYYAALICWRHRRQHEPHVYRGRVKTPDFKHRHNHTFHLRNGAAEYPIRVRGSGHPASYRYQSYRLRRRVWHQHAG